MGTMRRPPAVPTVTSGPVPPVWAPESSPHAQHPTRPGARPMANPKAPHPTAANRSTRALGRAAALRRVRTVLGWAAPIWLCLVYLSVSEMRPGLRGFLGLGYLLLLWFFLSRTKTLSWQSLGALVSIGLPWALVVGLITRPLASGLGQVEVDDLGARTALAA